MAIRQVSYEPDYDVVPQAIFWRSLECFAMVIREGVDGLDVFKAASFVMGNEVQFDLRNYRGHPKFTVTLYLPNNVEPERIGEIIDLIIKEMHVAPTAVAWRRGQVFKYGHLDRTSSDRLREEEARILVLKIVAKQENYSATLKFIQEQVPKYIALSPIDRQMSPSRKNEQQWQIIVRNVTSSHRSGKKGLFDQGYALKVPNGISITTKGLSYLSSMGFSASEPSLLENLVL